VSRVPDETVGAGSVPPARMVGSRSLRPVERWRPSLSHPFWVLRVLPWRPEGAGDRTLHTCWGVRGSFPGTRLERWGPNPSHLLGCSGLLPWHPEERWDRTFRTRGYFGLCHLCPEERWGPGLSHPIGYSRFFGRGARGTLGTEPFTPSGCLGLLPWRSRCAGVGAFRTR
jgi:hypothetical protein